MIKKETEANGFLGIIGIILSVWLHQFLISNYQKNSYKTLKDKIVIKYCSFPSSCFKPCDPNNFQHSHHKITIVYEEIWILAYSPDLWEKGHHDDVILANTLQTWPKKMRCIHFLTDCLWRCRDEKLQKTASPIIFVFI